MRSILVCILITSALFSPLKRAAAGCGTNCADCPNEHSCTSGTSKSDCCWTLAKCTNKLTDTTNCGTCGHSCPTAINGTTTCAAGTCGITCASEYTKCSNTCTNLQNDNSNCGACGTPCSTVDSGASAVCAGGTCVVSCNTGYIKCGSTCVNLQDDNANCGTCGNTCQEDTPDCMAGTCVIIAPPLLSLQTGPNTSYSASFRLFSDYQVTTSISSSNGARVLTVDFFTDSAVANLTLPDGTRLSSLSIPQISGVAINKHVINAMGLSALYAATQVVNAIAIPGGKRKLLRALLDNPGCNGFIDTACTIPCCAVHDKCYYNNGCSALSWIHVEGYRCDACNGDVMGCILASFSLTCDQCANNAQIGKSCYDHTCDTFYDCPGGCPCSLTNSNSQCCNCPSPCLASGCSTQNCGKCFGYPGGPGQFCYDQPSIGGSHQACVNNKCEFLEVG
jgi:hypothetical protein